jgi:hypothetical protein
MNNTGIIKPVNIHTEIRKMCPSYSSCFFNNQSESITILLDSDIGKDKRKQLQAEILNYLGRKMLHGTYNTIKIMW